MPVVLVVASAIEDGSARLIGQFGRMREQPSEIRFRSAHFRADHEVTPVGILDKSALMRGGRSWLIAENWAVHT